MDESGTAPRRNPAWTRDELLLALDLYLRFRSAPPGKDGPEVAQLSALLGRMSRARGLAKIHGFRNTNGVYMKMMNFMRFDAKDVSTCVGSPTARGSSSASYSGGRTPRPADPAGARRAPQSRTRKVDANDQGREHQGQLRSSLTKPGIGAARPHRGSRSGSMGEPDHTSKDRSIGQPSATWLARARRG
jgi:hypothetical protein